MRADLAVADVLNISRNKACELIKNGSIFINNEPLKKTNKNLNTTDEIKLLGKIYVSRAALKLKGFLEDLGLNLNGICALDVGSSSGGFTQILLENGVLSVTALDVGSNQLDINLRQNPKIIIKENTDIREFKSDKFDLVTVDVSFISLLKILPNIDGLAKKDIIILYKPQFEVGNNIKRNSKGVITDQMAIKKAKSNFEKSCLELGWKLNFTSSSKITGKEGNLEFLYYYTKK